MGVKKISLKRGVTKNLVTDKSLVGFEEEEVEIKI